MNGTRRTVTPWARVAGVVAAAAAILVATTLSSLDRPVADTAIAALVAGAAVFGLATLARVVLGPDGSLAAPLAAALLSVLGVGHRRAADARSRARAGGDGRGGRGGVLGVSAFTRQQVAWPLWAPAAATVLGCGLLVLPWLPGIKMTVGGAHLGVTLDPLSGNPVELARPLLAALLAIRIAETGPLLRRVPAVAASDAVVTAPLTVASLLLVAAGDLGPLLILGLTTTVLLMIRPAPPIVAAIVAAPPAGALAAYALSSVRGVRLRAHRGRRGTRRDRGGSSDRPVLIISRSLWRSTARARGDRSRLVAAAMALLISIQAIYTTAGVLGIVPLTGMTVPFVSRGGSALIGLWATLAVGVGLGAVRANSVRPVAAASPPVPRRASRSHCSNGWWRTGN